MMRILFQGDSITDVGSSADVADKMGFGYPLQEKFDEALKIAPSEYWCVDGVHPTACGHELIKREWIKAFKKLIN